MTVGNDKQGREGLKLSFNTNKVDIEQVDKECRDVGILFSMLDSKLIRTDIERHQQLQHNLLAYHSILSQSKTGQNRRAIYDSSFRVGTGALQIELYDKSLQAKLDVPNIVRTEVRYLKSKYLNREGLYSLQDLLSTDICKLMTLYNRGKDMYLGKLDSLQNRKVTVDIGSNIKLFEQLHRTSSRPLTTFLQLVGMRQVSIDDLLLIIQSADIPKQKRYSARKHILKLSEEILTEENSIDMVKELLTYFAA
jgi:hypothetical protein